MDSLKAGTFASFAALFASATTLVCCALPALFVVLGAGAVWAGLMGSFPGLILISEHKGTAFSLAIILLTVAGIMLWRARSLPCPNDAKLAMACARARRWSKAIFALALICLLIGGFFAFAAPYFL